MSQASSADPDLRASLPTNLWVAAYQRYFRFWMNLAKTVNVSAEEAKDLVHGVISAILSDPSRNFESLEHLRNYVARSVLNRAIQAKQRNDRKSPWSEGFEQQFGVVPDLFARDTEALSEALRHAIIGLPKNDYEIIKLRFFSGLTFNEISGMLKMPMSTLKSREEAAIKRIRKYLRKRGFDEVI